MFMLSVNGYSIFFIGNIDDAEYDVLDAICQKISMLKHNNDTELLFHAFSELVAKQLGKKVAPIKIQKVFRIE